MFSISDISEEDFGSEEEDEGEDDTPVSLPIRASLSITKVCLSITLSTYDPNVSKFTDNRPGGSERRYALPRRYLLYWEPLVLRWREDGHWTHGWCWLEPPWSIHWSSGRHLFPLLNFTFAHILFCSLIPLTLVSKMRLISSWMSEVSTKMSRNLSLSMPRTRNNK